MAQYINDNGEYYNGKSLTYDGKLYISPGEEIIIAAGYHKVETPSPDPVILARQLKLADIEDEDNSKEEFIINGQTMWLGHELRQQLKTSVEAYAASGQETVTKWFNGQEFTFSINIWLQMLIALEIYAAEVLNTTEMHRSRVLALTTAEDIQNYDCTVGYPQKLNFNQEWIRSI